MFVPRALRLFPLFLLLWIIGKLVLKTHNKLALQGGMALVVTVNLWQTRFASEGDNCTLFYAVLGRHVLFPPAKCSMGSNLKYQGSTVTLCEHECAI
ncbi:hypothetical protein AVEN_245294-1 [Araneus ventricosus]|uniref:Uncharacterized protein n=1 Tax=Araneus ventricosus TaxID=182803 RepID=A0A4Y2TGQ9_ARAVE|nr:hypothetical protein AVEN_245294-1 [Araneus ventricosus]